MENLKKVVFATLLVVAAGLVSFVLGGFSEALSLKLGCENCTPGMIIANRMAPADQPHAIDVFARRLSIGVAIDAPIWFAVICGVLILVALRRRRRKNV